MTEMGGGDDPEDKMSQTSTKDEEMKKVEEDDSRLLLEPPANEGRDYNLRIALGRVLAKATYATCTMALISSVVFVALKYVPNKDIVIYYDFPDIALCLVFLVEYIMQLYVSQHKLGFILQLSSIADIFIFLPIVILYNFREIFVI
jgi:hypothetical protein